MAITTAMCNSFKQELLGGVHDLDTDTLKIALIKVSHSGTYGAATTNYSDVTGATDEAVGTNYTAGGQGLDSAAIALDAGNNTAFLDFADEVFANLTISAVGAIIYNSSKSNKAIALFALTSNCNMIVATAVRKSRYMKLALTCIDVLDIMQLDKSERSIRNVTQWYNAQLENEILRAPHQYWWLHRRWKAKIKRRRQKR